MKAHALTGSTPVTQSARTQLSTPESAQLLALLDDVNTVVKHVGIYCLYYIFNSHKENLRMKMLLL